MLIHEIIVPKYSSPNIKKNYKNDLKFSSNDTFNFFMCSNFVSAIVNSSVVL